MAIKNQALTVTLFIVNTNTGLGVSGLTNSDLTLKIIQDGTEANITNTITEIGAGSYSLSLTAAQMNYDSVTVIPVPSNSSYQGYPINIITEQGDIADLQSGINNLESNMTTVINNVTATSVYEVISVDGSTIQVGQNLARKYPLTSIERLLFYTGLNDTLSNRRELQSWMHAASNAIRRYLDREVFIVSRLQYWNTIYKKQEYFFKAYPIIEINQVDYDDSGEFNGLQQTISSDYYHIGGSYNSLVLDWDFQNVKRGLRVTYSGGLAYHPTNSEFETSGLAGSFTAGNYVSGSTSGAYGKVVSYSDDVLTINVLDGIFETGDLVTEYSDSTLETTAGASATIDSANRRALCEAYMDITRACEVQVRYMWKHKDDFENNSTQQTGESIRRSYGVTYDLEPEARMLLDPYTRNFMFA